MNEYKNETETDTQENMSVALTTRLNVLSIQEFYIW